MKKNIILEQLTLEFLTKRVLQINEVKTEKEGVRKIYVLLYKVHYNKD